MVTPSRRPLAASSRISLTSAVSTKNLIALFSSCLRLAPARRLLSNRPIRNRDCRADKALHSLLSSLGTTETSQTAERAAVLVPVALDQLYDYRVPPGLSLAPGMFVLVPFGNQERLAVVWDPAPGADERTLDEKKLKAITAVLETPPLPAVSRRFAEWIAGYTLNPLGMVVRMMMSASTAFEPERHRFGVRLAGPAPDRLTPARRRVLEAAADGLIRAKSALAAEAGVSVGVIDGLVTAGALVDIEIPAPRPAIPNPAFSSREFAEAQDAAVHLLRSAVDARTYSASLLDGVTGSGKTEVYFEAVARALEQGRQVLILLPEIALTSQFISRFEGRFGVRPVEWHSGVGGTERGRIWRWAATGEARVVVGARSALFLPYSDLGLIVIDEEHDAGFKQEDRVTYHARDMAVVRARLGNLPIILASATPSIESHVNARTGRYRHLVLPSRFSGTELPEIVPIDLRRQPPERGRWLSPVLTEAVTETMASGQQSLLFLNRRGYAPLTLCRGCGHRFECPQCTAWLVEHRFRNRLTCHHCGFSLPMPEKCPKCSAEDSLVPCGPGVERIAEEVRERWPEARLAILSSDLIAGMKELRELITQIESGEADIIIGTQIVAKGHHFPALATVGVVDGDLGLAQGADPRAGERTFQLLHQVTGRAGRTFAQGRGLIQTHMPEHPVMDAIISGDREAFLDREIRLRQQALLPPYGRLAALVVSARQKEIAEGYAREVARRAPPADFIEVLGPAEAPIAVVRGRHRFRLLVKAPRDRDIQAYLRAWLELLPKVKGDLRLAVDIDPYNFL
ncbi:MAG: primosomal protein N' [Hyphomicrobiaceae bacterium]